MEDYINQQNTIELLRKEEIHMKKQRLMDLEIELKEKELAGRHQSVNQGM